MKFADPQSRDLYQLFQDIGTVVPTQVNTMSLLGIRLSNKSAIFDDLVGAVVHLDGILYVRMYPATTDPGIPYLKKPINRLGTAVVPSGYHPRLWRRGLHQGRYPALVQARPMELYRDNNRNIEIDPDRLVDHSRSVGINLHRASRYWKSTQVEQLLQLSVGRWSAGCQVIASATHFEYLMWFVNEVDQRYFDYTLLDNTQEQLFRVDKVDSLGRLTIF